MQPTSLLLAAALAFVAAAPPTQSNPAQNSVPVIQSNTRAVVVEVVVTQGQDEPVTALPKQDFQLLEDGRPQAIDFFEEHTAPASAASALAPLPKMPPNVYTNVPAAPLSDSVNVLLLDSLNTPIADQSYVHQQILDFLKTMKPATRIAIFTLGSKLSLIQGFTDDPALLKAALNDKNFGFKHTKTDVSRSRSDDDDDKAAVAAKAEAFGGGTRGGGGRGMGTAGVAALRQSQSELIEFQADQRTAMTLEALQSLGRYLAGIPGRKNLIWFASSYPIYFFPTSSERQPFNNHREFTTEIKQTSDLLTLSKVAVYPIDAEGMMNDHPMDAEHDLAAAGMGSGLLANTMNGAAQRSSTMSSMEQLAADTGGEAIFNNNDLNAALNHAIHNGEHYYTIVYTPTNKAMNGQFRRIQIKLDQGKYKLSYRRGYYADEAATPRSNLQASLRATAAAQQPPPEIDSDRNPLQGLMVRGMPSATQVLYGVRVVPAATQPAANAKRAGFNPKLTGPTTRYTADFMVRYTDVKLQPTPQGKHFGRMRVELLAYDHDGKALNWTGGTMDMNLNAETYAAIQHSGIPAHFEIDLPNTDVYLATGVYDFETGKAGTLEIPLTAGSVNQASSAVPANPATK